MARKGEPDLSAMFAMTALGGIMAANFGMAAAAGLGEAIGATVRAAVNAKRVKDWEARLQEKTSNIQHLLGHLDEQRRSGAIGVHTNKKAVTVYLDLSQQFQAAFDNSADGIDLYYALDDVEQNARGLITNLEREANLEAVARMNVLRRQLSAGNLSAEVAA